MIKKIAFCTLFLTALHAAPTKNISRYGKTVLPEDFKHFPHVNPDAPKGGKIRLSTVGTYDILSHFVVKGIAPEGLNLVFDPLMKRNPAEPFSLYPLIAEKVDMADDASAITISIHPKARFHNGDPITAKDIVFTVNLLKEKGLPRYRHYFSQIETITVKDDRTLHVTFKKTDNGYDRELPLVFLIQVRPLSEKSLQGIDFANSGMAKIVGSGPYKIGTADQGHSVTYERVQDYWAKDIPSNVGCYNFDEIQIDYYKNTASQFQAFLAGESDIYFETDPNHWHSAYKNAVNVKNGQIKQVKLPHERPVAVKSIIFNMRNTDFADKNVRDALVYAFDFDTLNRMMFFGEMKRANSLFANTSLAHTENAYVPPSTNGHGDQRENLKKAQELLEKSGWVLTHGKCMKDGKQLTFDFHIKDPKLEKVAVAYAKSLSKLGVKLNVRLVDTVQYENRTSSRKFDMIIHTWANSWSPGGEQLYYFSAKYADVEGSTNYIGVKDPKAEELAKLLAPCVTYDQLTKAVHTLDHYIMHQNWMIPLNYDPNLYYAYWHERVVHPTVDPKTGMNIMEYGYKGAKQ